VGLTFGYPGNGLLFREAQLLAPANGTTLIHGPSGSGKSTLINLMLRFYAPTQGTILFGGAPIDGFARLELRQKIGVVTQDHFIFSDSLRDNIRIANPDAGDDRIMDALARARLAGLVERLPGGLDYRLDPRGKGLSAGERQRICIARILLRDSPIMLLDEPWSNLDEEVRYLLASVINECRSSKTVVIMSHEDIPSLTVDRVYRLVPEIGKIVQEDRQELLNAWRSPGAAP
jgi:ABC-type multidrug transport system fused ATPase/permease subunit